MLDTPRARDSARVHARAGSDHLLVRSISVHMHQRPLTVLLWRLRLAVNRAARPPRRREARQGLLPDREERGRSRPLPGSPPRHLVPPHHPDRVGPRVLRRPVAAGEGAATRTGQAEQERGWPTALACGDNVPRAPLPAELAVPALQTRDCGMLGAATVEQILTPWLSC